MEHSLSGRSVPRDPRREHGGNEHNSASGSDTDGRPPLGLITTDDLARLLQVTPDTILRWTRRGRIPCVRVGKRTLRFDADAVLVALATGGHGGGAA